MATQTTEASKKEQLIGGVVLLLSSLSFLKRVVVVRPLRLKFWNHIIHFYTKMSNL